MSADDDVLVIPCFLSDSDTLTVTGTNGMIKFEAFDKSAVDRKEDRTITYLDAARVRALFNWLGVQLHKGGLK